LFKFLPVPIIGLSKITELLPEQGGLTNCGQPLEASGHSPKGSAKFPTKLVLDDTEADVVADAFNERLRIMLRIAHERQQALF
jgi:hypothetical protein